MGLLETALQVLVKDTDRLVRRMLHKAVGCQIDPRRCILYSLVARDTFRMIGFTAEVLPCTVKIQNRATLENLGIDRGAYRLIIGDTINPPTQWDGWNGHLVTVVQDRLFIDLSLAQASRPQHGIRLSPMYGPYQATTPTPEELQPSFARLLLDAGRPGECEVVWQANPSNLGWLDAPDTREERRRKIVGKLVKTIYRALRER